MVPLDGVTALTRQGLLGDCHAQPLGPRQVLVVREESLTPLGVAAWQVRANIATHGLDASSLESGRVLQVGADTRIRITHVCEICKVLRGYVPARTFAALARRRGSLGVILSGGTIAIGDSIAVERRRYPVVPEAIFDRVAWVVGQIPRGRVALYDQLLTLVGGSRPYFRVLPSYLRRAEAAGLPAHRVLDSGRRVTGHLPDQAARLRAEGVPVDNAGVLGGDDHLWDARDLFVRRAVSVSTTRNSRGST